MSVALGVAMATAGNELALERRDAIVGGAQSVRGPSGPTWLGLPRDRVGDAALAYVVIAPLFLVASLWEFLARQRWSCARSASAQAARGMAERPACYHFCRAVTKIAPMRAVRAELLPSDPT